jgi:hypothetical protein
MTYVEQGLNAGMRLKHADYVAESNDGFAFWFRDWFGTELDLLV